MSGRRASGIARPVAVALLLAACSGDADEACVTPPCALPFAVQLTVRAAAGAGPVTGVTVRVSGAVTGSASCAAGSVTSCVVPGGAGTYELDVAAPGFAPAHRSVVVTGTTPRCGCPSIDTQQVDVALAPAA